jgi:MFS family permease
MQVASKSVTEAAVQQQQLLQCRFPNPCWCDVSSTARAWFVTLRMVATAAAALPAAWLSRLAGRRTATFTGVVLTLVGEQSSDALL